MYKIEYAEKKRIQYGIINEYGVCDFSQQRKHTEGVVC